MKKTKGFSVLIVLACLISGCSCSKVSEDTFADAVNVYKNTDAISYTRIEEIKVEGEDIYTRKQIKAKFISEV